MGCWRVYDDEVNVQCKVNEEGVRAPAAVRSLSLPFFLRFSSFLVRDSNLLLLLCFFSLTAPSRQALQANPRREDGEGPIRLVQVSRRVQGGKEARRLLALSRGKSLSGESDYRFVSSRLRRVFERVR